MEPYLSQSRHIWHISDTWQDTCSERIGNKNGNRDYYKLPISPKLFSLCSREVSTAQTKKFWSNWQTFETLLFVQSRHSKLYCLCNRDIQNFIVCAVETFETLLFVQSRHSKLYCLCSRSIRKFLVCVSLLGLLTKACSVETSNISGTQQCSISTRTMQQQENREIDRL